ncbi:MAG: DUF308 domain-containing protein [Bacteroidales bacterium]|jgi:uncharacterized membrane protein HdeD (DUF308 family)|nr:DUF308 domain-containing protein [Bacteroidales bacterium]
MKTTVRFNNPWIIGVQGFIMILFGMAAIVNPEITLNTITRFFGILMLVSGVFIIILAKSESENIPIFWFYEGIANVVMGLLFIVFPKAIAGFFVILIGIIALIIGIRNLWLVVNNKPDFMILGLIRNAILITFGLLFLFIPFNGAIVIINVIGFVALIYGSVTIFMVYKILQKNR